MVSRWGEKTAWVFIQADLSTKSSIQWHVDVLAAKRLQFSSRNIESLFLLFGMWCPADSKISKNREETEHGKFFFFFLNHAYMILNIGIFPSAAWLYLQRHLRDMKTILACCKAFLKVPWMVYDSTWNLFWNRNPLLWDSI